jgi:hypothetical protein
LIGEVCNLAICEAGVNDLGATTNAIMQNMTNLWTVLNAQGIRVYQTTITPNSTSSDGWTTTNNQVGQNTATRAFINTWLRTCPAPLTGIWDLGSALETSTNANIWKPGFTPDGLHPQTSNGQSAYKTRLQSYLPIQ